MSLPPERQCIVCEKSKEEHEGIMLVTEFICCDCEAEIVRTDVKDAKYPFFIHQLKRVWYKQNA